MKLISYYPLYLLRILPILTISRLKSEIFLNISSTKFIYLFTFLKYHTHCQYKILTDIIGIDYLSKKRRFHIIYNLLSIRFNHRIFIQIQLKDWESIPSIISIYRNANWFEREIWDMFGIFFTNHPDLRRILTDYGFEGYPLRKDYPLSGYFEVYFNENKKQVQYKPINLSQEYRLFQFKNPWIQ